MSIRNTKYNQIFKSKLRMRNWNLSHHLSSLLGSSLANVIDIGLTRTKSLIHGKLQQVFYNLAQSQLHLCHHNTSPKGIMTLSTLEAGTQIMHTSTKGKHFCMSKMSSLNMLKSEKTDPGPSQSQNSTSSSLVQGLPFHPFFFQISQ